MGSQRVRHDWVTSLHFTKPGNINTKKDNHESAWKESILEDLSVFYLQRTQISYTEFLNTSIKKLIHKSHKVVKPFNNNGIKGRCSTCQSGFTELCFHIITWSMIDLCLFDMRILLICLLLRKHYNNLYWKFLGNSAGNSLAVQWLRLCSLTPEGPSSTTAQGTKIPQAT